MPIWSAEIQELERLYKSLKGQFPELEKELGQLIHSDDPNVILLYSRRCLEVIITDLCECELKRPRKTEPLKGIIDKLYKEEKVPSHIITSMHGLNELSTYGTHPKDFDPEQVKPVLINLDIIIKWYLKYKDTQAIGKQMTEDVKDETKVSDDVTGKIQKSNKKLILLISGVVLVVIVVLTLFVFDIIGGGRQIKKLEKYIAVLPFEVWNSDEEFQYLGNAIANEINTQLCIVKKFHVISYTSSSRYKGSDELSIPQIGKELGANFIIEGSVERQLDNVSIHVQVINAKKDDHFWAQEFKDKWNNLIALRADIAKKVADVLNTTLTPEEKQLIEKNPTDNYAALVLYQKGRDEHTKYWIDNNTDALEIAEKYYREAINEDINYAQAYCGLARAIWDKNKWRSYVSKGVMDSVLFLCEHAISIDNQLSEAYTVIGDYYRTANNKDKALDAYNKAIDINPNDPFAYIGMAYLFTSTNPGKSIYYLKKAIQIYRGQLLPEMYRGISKLYSLIDLKKESKEFADWAIGIDGDSVQYYKTLSDDEFISGNLNAAYNYLKRAVMIDTNNAQNQWSLGQFCLFLGEYKESLKHFEKWLEKSDTLNQETLFAIHRFGYAYELNGNKSAATHYYNKQIKYGDKMIELGKAGRIYYDLAGVYAVKGEKQKALDNLNRLYKWVIRYESPYSYFPFLRFDPELNSIRNEPEFQKIFQEMGNNLQTMKDREKKWLEEQGML